jgi:hypothetical protein
MNKLTTTIIAASLLTVPFSTYAADVSLDDMYRYDDFSAYEVVQSSSPGKNIDVTLDDMYRYEDFGAYNLDTGHQNSNQTAGSSVFSSTTKATESIALYHTY